MVGSAHIVHSMNCVSSDENRHQKNGGLTAYGQPSHATFHMPHPTFHIPPTFHSTFHRGATRNTEWFPWNRVENMSRTVSDGKEAHSPQYMHSTCIACPAILVTFSTLIHGSNSVFCVGPRWKVEWTMWNLRKWDYCGIWNKACGMWHVARGMWNMECGMRNVT